VLPASTSRGRLPTAAATGLPLASRNTNCGQRDSRAEGGWGRCRLEKR
jgi:hypothetical protein